MRFFGRYTPLQNLPTHTISKIVEIFDPEMGKEKDDKGEPKICRWSIGLLLQA